MVGEETEVLEFLSLKQKKLELDPNIKHFNYLNIGESKHEEVNTAKSAAQTGSSEEKHKDYKFNQKF